MPVRKCKTESGKSGYQYGSQKCYPGGKAAKKKAIKQGLAIARSQGRKPKL